MPKAKKRIALAAGQLEPRLANRVLELASEFGPEEFPPVQPDEDLEVVMRQKSEDLFQYALCRRIWWRLTREERAGIRGKLMAANSRHSRNPSGSWLENDCFDEIGKLLAAARGCR